MGWVRKHPELVILGVFIAVVVVGIVRYQTRSSPPPSTAGDLPSVAAVPTQPAAPATSAAASSAQALADEDGDVSPVGDYQAALDALVPKCTQDEAHIAALGDAGYSDLTKNGIKDETRLSVLQHLDASIPAGLGKTDCAGMLSAYLVLREQG